MVVDYIVGQVLTGERGVDLSAADRLDEVTAYYLLHRHDFRMDEAPVGACILYATACGLSDSELEKTWDVLVSSGKAGDQDEVEGEGQRTRTPKRMIPKAVVPAAARSSSSRGINGGARAWAMRPRKARRCR